MLRKSHGFDISKTLGGRTSTRLVLLETRQNYSRQIPYYRKGVFSKSSLISPKKLPRQFSSLPGSWQLRFYDPWLRWDRTRSRLAPSNEDDDSQSTSFRPWMTTSPTGSEKENIINRTLLWLRRCLKRLYKLFLFALRSGVVIFHLSPLMLLVPTAFFSNRISNSPVISNITWNYAVKIIQRLGPVAVKFCQWAATRRDIFHPSLCDRLSILHDSGYPHSLQWTHRLLTEAFGDYQRKGLVIGDVIGCGAAAQVYRGKLIVNVDSTEAERPQFAREVAIKVLHPRFHEMVERDLDFMHTAADILHSLPIDYFRMLNFPKAVEDFSIALRDQVDLRTEATNLRKFEENFNPDSQKNAEIKPVIFPQPIDDWTSRHVMVEEYISDAVPIGQFLRDSSEEGMDRRKELAAPLLRAFLKMVFIDNFVHGDLHPGNVLVKTTFSTDSSSTWSIFSPFGRSSEEQRETQIKAKRSIVFLDAGIVVSLSPDDRKNLFDLFRAVVFNDGTRAGRLMVERAKYERCSQNPSSVERFSKGIEEIVKEFHDRRKEGLTLGAVRIGVLLNRVLDLCRIYGVEIDPAMANVVISTLVLEGLGRSLSPDLDLLTFARPFLLLRGEI